LENIAQIGVFWIDASAKLSRKFFGDCRFYYKVLKLWILSEKKCHRASSHIPSFSRNCPDFSRNFLTPFDGNNHEKIVQEIFMFLTIPGRNLALTTCTIIIC